MNEMDSVSVTNVTNEEFTFGWNSQEYTIPPRGVKSYPIAIAMHAAKHLAKKILIKKGVFVDTKDDLKSGKGHVVKVTDIENVAERLLNREAKALAASRSSDAADEVVSKNEADTPPQSQTAEEAATEQRNEKLLAATGLDDPQIAAATAELKEKLEVVQGTDTTEDEIVGDIAPEAVETNTEENQDPVGVDDIVSDPRTTE